MRLTRCDQCGKEAVIDPKDIVADVPDTWIELKERRPGIEPNHYAHVCSWGCAVVYGDHMNEVRAAEPQAVPEDAFPPEASLPC